MITEKITDYTFDPRQGTVTLNGLTSVDPTRIHSIKNITQGRIYYLHSEGRTAQVSGNVIALPKGSIWLSDAPSDVLDIRYIAPDLGPQDDRYTPSLAPGWKQRWFGGSIRNMGAAGGYWKTIDDPAHWPFGISKVETNTLSIDVYYDFVGTGIGTVMVSMDETLSSQGWAAGASVEKDKCSIKLSRQRTIGDLISYNGTTWSASAGTNQFSSVSWSTANGGFLQINHSKVLGNSWSIESRTAGIIAQPATAGATDPAVQTRVAFYDVVTGAQKALADLPSDLKVYVSRTDAFPQFSINPQSAPDQLELPNSNIWLLGVHHVGPRP